jgi:SAM-dependent methyltransferase
MSGCTDQWRQETARVTASFDRVADLYRREFADELDHKPFDRGLLDRVAERFPRHRPVIEVGAGPAHVSARIAPRLGERGIAVFASDASRGQLREARTVDPARSLLAADLACLPCRPGSLGGVLAFYCLIYGPPEYLNHVFDDWHRALRPRGVVVIAVHAGDDAIHQDEWHGRPVDVTIVLRDPDDLTSRLGQSGFVIEERTVRPPYQDEHQTTRCYVVAARGP